MNSTNNRPPTQRPNLVVAGNPIHRRPTTTSTIITRNRYIRLLIILSQLLGIAPVHIAANIRWCRSRHQPKKPPLNGRHHHIASAAHNAWSACLLGIIAWSEYQEYDIFLQYVPTVERYLIYVEYAFNLLNCAVIVVGANYQRRWYIEYLQRIESVDRRLASMATASASDQPVDQQLTRYLRRFFAILAAFVAMLLVVIFAFNPTGNGWIYSTLTYTVPNVMLLLALAKYVCLMNLLQSRFRRILDRINGLAASLLDADDGTMATEVGRTKSTPSGKTAAKLTESMLQLDFAAQRWFDDPKTSMMLVSSVDDGMNQLRHIYHDLCDLATNVNRSFGWLIIGILCSGVFILTGQLYSLYMYVTNGSGRTLSYVYACGWFVTNSAKCMLLMEINGRMMDEVSWNGAFMGWVICLVDTIGWCTI